MIEVIPSSSFSDCMTWAKGNEFQAKTYDSRNSSCLEVPEYPISANWHY